jgi:hypothetical protein
MSIKNENDLENGLIQLSSQKNMQIPDILLIEIIIDIFYEWFRFILVIV